MDQGGILEGDGRGCQPLHLQLRAYGGDRWGILRYRITGVADGRTTAEKHVRELIPGGDDPSVYEIFFLLTQSGNGREQGTLLGVLYRRRSTSVESLAEK